VDSPDERFEIKDRECPGIEASVPADDVERMMGLDMTGNSEPGLDQDFDILTIANEWIARRTQVSL
jgi:hypothetical protein